MLHHNHTAWGSCSGTFGRCFTRKSKMESWSYLLKKHRQKLEMNDPDVLQHSHQPSDCPTLNSSAPWQFFFLNWVHKENNCKQPWSNLALKRNVRAQSQKCNCWRLIQKILNSNSHSEMYFFISLKENSCNQMQPVIRKFLPSLNLSSPIIWRITSIQGFLWSGTGKM